MKHRCVRCVARLQLHKLSWVNEKGKDIILDGSQVFLRACVLGQLQHTHPHTPSFPIIINQQLSFDRVFSNCRDPNLLPEVLVGEHVRIELIQLNDDHTGGRILARYESPTRSFLFPSNQSPAANRVVEVTMNRSRKYKCPPKLTLASSVSMSEVTIAPPIQPALVVSDDTLLSAPSLQQLSPSHSLSTSPDRHGQTTSSQSLPPSLNSAKTRLHTLLKSYSAQDANTRANKPASKSPVRTHRVKIKPPLPTFKKASFPREQSSERKVRTSPSKVQKRRVPLRQSSSRQVEKEQSYYTASTTSMGPHSWGVCPRRSSSRSLPSSPAGKRKSILVNKSSSRSPGASFTSPVRREPEVPFRVGTPDASLMERRDFCGELIPSPSSTVLHSASNTRQRTRSAPLHQRSPRLSSSLSTKPKGGVRKKLSWETTVPGSCPSRLPKSAYSDLHPSPRPGGCRLLSSDGALVRKYLTRPAGPGTGVGLGTSPSQLIGEKVDELLRECSDHCRDVESGEDSLTEDNDRLRASFAAEREETMNRTAQHLPTDSVVVRVGPCDFWSQRMAEFTGKPHRLVFDETLEKIYNRIYQDHAAMCTS